MKLTIDRRTFANALSEVAPFAPAKNPLPILKYAKVTTKGNRMKIEANDTQRAITKYIELVECDADGSFLIDIADLNKFVAKVKGESVTVSVEGESVRITHSNGSAEFQTVNADEYPVFRMPDKESTEITLPATVLADAIAKGRGFISADTLRPQLCAIYAYTEYGDKFGYCATDTHKLIHGWYGLESHGYPDVHWLIMPSVFPTLMNACKGNDTVKVQITDSHVSYRIGNTIIHTVQANGTYPNFRRVIPQTYSMECAVDKDGLLDSIQRVSMFCPSSSRCIKLRIGRMDMSVSGDDLDTMKSSKESISHNGCDGEITIGVNADHMLSALAVFGGDVLWRMTDETRPVLMVEPDNEKMQCIVMPMNLNS